MKIHIPAHEPLLKGNKNIDIADIDIAHLEDLKNRLVDNYNNGTEFEQFEEDRLELWKVVEFLESLGDTE